MWVKLSDDMPEDSATVRSASTCPPCGHSGKHPMADCPLTPGVAIAIAAILDAHPRRMPHWLTWAEDLRRWADAVSNNISAAIVEPIPAADPVAFGEANETAPEGAGNTDRGLTIGSTPRSEQGGTNG